MFSRTPLLSIILSNLVALASAGLAPRQYTVINNCPTSIKLYIESENGFDSTIATGGSVTRTLGVDSGFFFTTENNGNVDDGATRAGFYGDGDSYYYYIVKDVTHFNTGMSITPNHNPYGAGFCPVARCDNVACGSAFSQPPSSFPPPSNGVAPALPVYSCPFSDLAFNIIFCPSKSFPLPPVVIHPNGNPDKCLDVRGAIYADGTAVQIFDCNRTGAQKWFIDRGNTQIRVAGTNFCLDAGSNPGNGAGMKIWQCSDNLPAQQWNFSNDNRISLLGTGQYLDLPNGVPTNNNQLQTWQSVDGNTNQVWTDVSVGISGGRVSMHNALDSPFCRYAALLIMFVTYLHTPFGL